MARSIFILCCAVAILWLYLDRRMLAALIEGLNDFRDNFRGGPPPTHPSPAGDDALLRPWKKRIRRTH